MKLANLSIRYKLILINVFMVLVALLVILAAELVKEVDTQKETLKNDLVLQAKILASNSTASLAFTDQAAAAETLKALSVSPHVIYAAIYVGGEKLFAEFKRQESQARSLPKTGNLVAVQMSNDRMGVTEEIILDDEKLGLIYIEADLTFITELMMDKVRSASILLFVIFGVMLIMMHKLQRNIIQPLHDLVAVMRRVIEEKSYSVRANVARKDELGMLAKGFNDMLAQLGERDAALMLHREQLEQMVAQRTAKLTEAQRLARLGSWECDVNATFVWSDELYMILGLLPRQTAASYDAFCQQTHPLDLPDLLNGWQQLFEQNRSFAINHRVIRFDGSIVYVFHKAEAVFGADGQVQGWAGTVQDVTEQHEMLVNSQKNEALWSFALEGTGDCVWDWDLRTGFVSLSKAGSSMFGYSEDEAGHNITDWFPRVHPDDRILWKQLTPGVSSGELERFSFEYRLLCKSGQYRWFLSRGMAVEADETGRPGRLIGVMTDINERRETEERLALFARIFDASERAICVTDGEWRVIYINPAFQSLYGYVSSEVLGQLFTMFFPQQSMLLEDFVIPLAQGESWNGLLRQSRKDGSEFESASSIGVIRDQNNNPRYYFNILYDYSSEIERQQQLQLAVEKADAANRYKSEFLSNMSHEIRTPMNAIIGLSQLCLQTSLSVKQFDYMDKIHYSAQSLLGIINDILDFSKIEAGKMTIESVPFDIADVMNNLATVIGTKSDEKGLRCSINVAPAVQSHMLIGDPLRLGQVLINLMGNAVKFTEKGGVSLNVEMLDCTDGQAQLQFVVADSGIGLTNEQMGRLFQSFSQADGSTSRRFGGTGLGLSISKSLVEMMGGRIWVESTYGEGTRFYFTASLHQGIEIVDPDLVDHGDLSALSILIADDDPASCFVLKDLLSTFNCRLESVDNGVDALSLIRHASLRGRPFELAILDWKMPQMGGLGVAEQLLLDDAIQHKPKVILISASDREELEQYLTDQIVHCVLTKPIIKASLHKAVLKVLGLDKKRQQKRPTLFDEDALAKIAGAHLLLVEDNEINQQVASELLEKAGVRVTIAGNGELALQRIAEQSFDGVLMDMQMPVMDGLQATRLIRQQPRHADLPILAMTANALSADRTRCLEAGMNDHISKPFKANDMVMTLAKWIKPAHPQLIAPQQMSEQEANIELPYLVGVNVEASVERMGGSVSIYRKALSRFYQEQQNAVLQLQQALQSEDQGLAQRLTHTLAGLLATLGVDELAELVRRMEAKIKQAELVAVLAMLPELEQKLPLLLEQIGQVLEQPCDLPVSDCSNNNQVDAPSLAQIEGIRVLIAEDSPMNRMVLEDMLESGQVVFSSAEDGQQAVELVQQHGAHAFDIVLTDVHMPRMGGYELSNVLAELAPGLPVVGVTANTQPAEQQLCMDEGMVACISKPLDKALLFATIKAHARSPQPTEERSTIVSQKIEDFLDWPALLAEFGGREAFVNKLLDAMLQKHTDTPQKLREAAEQGNFTALAFVAHSLAGVSGQLKASALSQLARQIEQQAKAEDRAVCEAVLPLADQAAAFVCAVQLKLGVAAPVIKPASAIPLAPVAPAAKPLAQPVMDSLESFVDWSELLAEFGGREAFVDKLLMAMLKAHEATPNKLRDAAQTQDFKVIAFVAHSLAGVTGQLRASALSQLAKKVELDAKAERPEALAQIPELVALTERFIRILMQRFAA